MSGQKVYRMPEVASVREPVRLSEGDITIDTGSIQWKHESEPTVLIEDDATCEAVVVPIRMLREFLSLYDEERGDA